jgi:hypothetical protein
VEGYPDVATIVGGREVALDTATTLAADLLQKAKEFDPVRWILDVNEDVLGVYEPARGVVVLYWGVIDLVAQMLAVSTQALTVVVLAHELAHAYSHCGLDIDGGSWPTEAFVSSERGFREGLAQYYTRIICSNLRGVLPEARTTFEQLLNHQGSDYRYQESWIERGYLPEHVRLAMLSARRSRLTRLSDFEGALEAARRTLGQPT